MLDSRRLRLATVVCIGGIARLFAAATTLTIAVDGVVYMRQARLLDAGHLKQALAIPYHIGYAACVCAIHRLLPLPSTPEGWELAGQVVSLITGFVTIFVLWKIGEEVFGEEAGFWCGLAAALNVQLVRFSAQVRSEALFFLLLCGALLFAIRFLKGQTVWNAAMCGLLTVLGYLVRPEALLVGVLFSAFCIVLFFARLLQKRKDGWRYAAGLGALVGVVTLCVLPHLYAIRPFGGVGKEKGSLKLTLKRDPLWLFERQVAERDYVATEEGVEQHYVVPHTRLKNFLKRYASNIGEGAHILASRVLHPVLALLVLFGLLGIFGRMKHHRSGTLFLLISAVGYFLLVSLFGVTHRHLTQTALFLLPFCGVGVVWLKERLKRRQRLLWLLAIVAAGLLLGRLVVARHSGYLAERQAGLFLRQNVPPFYRIACRLPRLVYYSDLTCVGEIQAPKGEGYRIRRRKLEWLLKEGCELVAVDAAPLTPEDRDYILKHKRLTVMGRFRVPPQDIIVLRVLPPPKKR